MDYIDGIPALQTGDPLSLTPEYSQELRSRLSGLPLAVAAGTASADDIPAGGYSDVFIPFPPGRFTRAPIVQVTMTSTTDAITMWAYYGASATGVTVRVYRSSAGGAGLAWLAVQI